MSAIRRHADPAPAVWLDAQPGWIPFDSAIAPGSPSDEPDAAEHPHQPVELLSLNQFAERLGLEAATLKSYRRDGLLPTPDALVSNRPGWLPGTVDQWRSDRRRRGRSAATTRTNPSAEAVESFLTLQDVGAELGISHTTARARLSTGDIPAPDVQIGSVAGWSTATVASLTQGHPTADRDKPRKFYTKAEVARLFQISPVAIVHAQRAGRWPRPDARCGPTVGWSLATIIEVRGEPAIHPEDEPR